MTAMNEDLIKIIQNDANLLKAICTAPSIDIIEYDATSIAGTISVLKLIETCSNQYTTNTTRRINVILLGDRNPKLIDQNEHTLKHSHNNLTIKRFKTSWKNIDFKELNQYGILTLHMLFDAEINIPCNSDSNLNFILMFSRSNDDTPKLREIIRETRNAFYAVFSKSLPRNLFDSSIKMAYWLTLEDIKFRDNSNQTEKQTKFCQYKQEYMDNAIKNVSERDAFFICFDEMESGCTECNQSVSYNSHLHFCPMAQCRVAEFYRKGDYIETNATIAHQWAMKADKQGYMPAKIILAEDLLNGFGCLKDVVGAVRIYSELACFIEYKHLADVVIGIVKENDDVPDSAAIKHLAMKANNCDEGAVLTLIESFKAGKYGLAVDPSQQEFWEQFLKVRIYDAPLTENTIDATIERAESGNLQAQIKLCNEYWYGRILKKDYKLCAYWGEKALEQEDKSVRFVVAYSSAKIGYTTRAAFLYTQLADEGNIAAMNNLACIETDVHKSAELFKRAADMGDNVAQSNIGRYYKRGNGVEQSYEMAIHYFELSAKQGYSEAMIELARIYRDGLGVDKDSEKMLEWYHKAADKNSARALLDLAHVYRWGDNVETDKTKALEYYHETVQSSDGDDYTGDSPQVAAMYEIGNILELGEGVARDIHKAVFWYRKAALHGNYDARRELKRMNLNWIDAEGETITE